MEWPLVVGIRFDFVVFGVRDNACDTITSPASNNRIVGAAGFDASFTVNATIAFDYAMACDAGDALAEDGRA